MLKNNCKGKGKGKAGRGGRRKGKQASEPSPGTEAGTSAEGAQGVDDEGRLPEGSDDVPEEMEGSQGESPTPKYGGSYETTGVCDREETGVYEQGAEEGDGSELKTSIDQQLEETAERRNLSVLNVKSILHVRMH